MSQWQKNLYISWFTQVLSLMGFGFMMPFIPLYIQTLGVTSPNGLRFWVGMLTSLPALALAVMGPIWGVLADRYGRKIMILRSMAAGVIVVGLMGFAPNVGTVFLLRLLQGVFTGTIAASATLVAVGTPSRRLASALGFLSTSTFIGYTIGPLIGGLCAELFSYRVTFLIGSAIIAAAFVLVLLYVREVKQPVPEPRESGAAFSPRIFLRLPFLVLLAILFLNRFASTLPNPFIPLYIQELRGSFSGTSAVTGAVLAAGGLASAFSGLTISRIGDRQDKVFLVLCLLGASALAGLPLFLTQGLAAFVIFYVLSVFFCGGIEPLIQSHLSVHTEPENRGVLFGIQTMVSNLGVFFSPIAGSLITIVLSIKHLFLFYSLFFFSTFGLLAVYRLAERKRAPGGPAVGAATGASAGSRRD